MKDDYIVKGFCSDCPRFLNSLLVDEGELLAGSYTVFIEPVWNESADLDPLYRKVNVDVYSPHDINLVVAGDEVFDQFQRAVLVHAKASDEKQYYMRNQPSLGDQLYRITTLDDLGCWLGYMYYCNNSECTID